MERIDPFSDKKQNSLFGIPNTHMLYSSVPKPGCRAIKIACRASFGCGVRTAHGRMRA
jgi:hypothetical protein